MRHPLRWHDALSAASALLAALCVGGIAVAYCYEVASRYVFASPTIWVNTVTTYLLLASVALAAPQISREARHVSISLLADSIGVRGATLLQRSVAAVAGLVCGCSAAITLLESLAQLRSGVVTIDPLQVPKWWFTALLTYGLGSSSLHFVRLAFGAEQAAVPPDHLD